MPCGLDAWHRSARKLPIRRRWNQVNELDRRALRVRQDQFAFFTHHLQENLS